MVTEDSQDLLDEYCEAVMVYKAGYTNGDKKVMEKGKQGTHDVLTKLVERGRDDSLIGLLSHEDKWIQWYAAMHLLEVREDIALGVLENIAGIDIPFLSTIAEITIDEWKKGNLRFRDK